MLKGKQHIAGMFIKYKRSKVVFYVTKGDKMTEKQDAKEK